MLRYAVRCGTRSSCGHSYRKVGTLRLHVVEPHACMWMNRDMKLGGEGVLFQASSGEEVPLFF